MASSLSGAAELIDSESNDDDGDDDGDENAIPRTRPPHALSALNPPFLRNNEADEAAADEPPAAGKPANFPPRTGKACPPCKNDDGPTTPPPTAKASVYTAFEINITATAARGTAAYPLETMFAPLSSLWLPLGVPFLAIPFLSSPWPP